MPLAMDNTVSINGVVVGHLRASDPPIARMPPVWQGYVRQRVFGHQIISPPFSTREEALQWMEAKHEELTVARAANALIGGDVHLHWMQTAHQRDHRALTLCRASIYEPDGRQLHAITGHLGEATCKTCIARAIRSGAGGQQR